MDPSPEYRGTIHFATVLASYGCCHRQIIQSGAFDRLTLALPLAPVCDPSYHGPSLGHVRGQRSVSGPAGVAAAPAMRLRVLAA